MPNNVNIKDSKVSMKRVSELSAGNTFTNEKKNLPMMVINLNNDPHINMDQSFQRTSTPVVDLNTGDTILLDNDTYVYVGQADFTIHV
jgi:hypothetical protein